MFLGVFRSFVRVAQEHLKGATSGLYLRVGKRGAIWSLHYRVSGHGGESATGHKIKGVMARLHLGDDPNVQSPAVAAPAIVQRAGAVFRRGDECASRNST